MIDLGAVPLAEVKWPSAVRIIRSLYPPIDLFEDIADPADWPLIISAEQKTNPRLMETIGNLDLVPPGRRAAGPGASYLMAPFTHISVDRPSRFSDGSFGVLYAGNSFEVALFETIFHHGRFMARTNEPAGWTSQFREIVLSVDARLHDIRGGDSASITRKAKRLERAYGLLDRTASPIRAFAIRAGSASDSSILTGPRILSKVGASTIIGTARASICAGILGAVGSIASFETARDIWAPRPTPATCYWPSALHVGRGVWLSRSITPISDLAATQRAAATPSRDPNGARRAAKRDGDGVLAYLGAGNGVLTRLRRRNARQ